MTGLLILVLALILITVATAGGYLLGKRTNQGFKLYEAEKEAKENQEQSLRLEIKGLLSAGSSLGLKLDKAEDDLLQAERRETSIRRQRDVISSQALEVLRIVERNGSLEEIRTAILKLAE